MLPVSSEILIVGAGPTGLVLAYELARRGLAFRLIDQNLGPAAQSRALVVQVRTLEIFHFMGIIDEVLKRLKDKNITVTIDKSLKDLIISKGTDENYGARPLRRAIQNMIEDEIAEAILDAKIKPNTQAKILAKDDKIVIE